VAILPTGFLLGSYIHERTHDEPIAREKLAAAQAQHLDQSAGAGGRSAGAETPEEKEQTRLKKEQELQALERERRKVQIRWELEDVTNKMEDVKSRGWDAAKKSAAASGQEKEKAR
jgi:hypothetical protein